MKKPYDSYIKATEEADMDPNEKGLAPAELESLTGGSGTWDERELYEEIIGWIVKHVSRNETPDVSAIRQQLKTTSMGEADNFDQVFDQVIERLNSFRK